MAVHGRSERVTRRLRGAGLLRTAPFLALLGISGTAAADVAQSSAWALAANAAPGAAGFSVSAGATFTVPAGTNRLLVVAAVLEADTAGTVADFRATFGGVSMTAAAASDGISGRETAKVWYLVDANIPGAASTLTVSGTHLGGNVTGIHVYRAVFTGVEQSSPIVSGNGSYNGGATVTFGAAISRLDGGWTLYAAGNGGSAATMTPPAGFTARLSSTANGHSSAVADDNAPPTPAAGTYPAGTTVSFTGTTSARSALSVISIRPSGADVQVTKSGPAWATLGSAVTFAITVTNNGTASASGVTLTDTLPAGLTFVSVTGTGCSGGATTTCSIGTLASGSSSVVTITATASSTGLRTNAASVTTTARDPFPGNNSASATVSVLSSVPCGSPGGAGAGGTLSGVVNSYWPGTANAAAGATSVTVGARTGAAADLSAGDLVLVIQMQDAAIDASNGSAYGDGVPGDPASGSTLLNSAGLYEFASVTSTTPSPLGAAGGTVNLSSTGSGGGLVNAYSNADASATQGQRRFQVIRVPQYSSASLGDATALAWSTNTAAPIGLGTGGVLVLDVAGALDVGGTTTDVSGLGFRGGAGRRLTGVAGYSDTDIRTPSTLATNGSKGEGIAGTPEWVAGTAGPLQTNQPIDGYPNGSYGRGAPGNAGGGSTDGNPSANDQNSGGGGGGNGGRGALGGNSWNSNLPVGGFGGAGYGASPTRILMGGGGGGGTRNNSDCDALAAAGAAGGGIVILRAGQITGTGTLRANGADTYQNTANDSGGGGGAGGTVVLIAGTGSLAGVTVEAHGGRGGDAWARASCSGTTGTTLADRHGPGGGGGGGVVISSFAVGSSDLAGGQSGVTTTLNDGFGTEPGAPGGSASIVATVSAPPGVGGGVACSCDPAIALSHTPNGGAPGGFLASNSSGYFTATTTNVAPFIATSGTLTVTLTLPAGLTPVASAAGQTLGGTGWTGCSIVGQTATCQRSDSVAAGASYPPMIVPFTTGTGPSLLTTTASLTVTGGTNANYNLANDSASDQAVLLSPTLARMGAVKVVSGPGGTSVTWRTSFEVSNLGFRVLREDDGVRRERTKELLAGSALFAGQNVTLSAGRQYRFVDPAPSHAATTWWIEAVDLSGARSWYGPYRAEASDGSDVSPLVSPYVSRLSEPRPAGEPNPGLGLERRVVPPEFSTAVSAATITQGQLAGAPAAKLSVTREGWYRVAKSELMAAGFDPGSDASRLRLFAEAVEQTFVVEDGGDGSFGAADSIEFYGTGLDTPSTDRRVYWLVSGGAAGLRAAVAGPPAAGGATAGGFPFAAEYRERVVYVAALTSLAGHDNFFGPVVGPSGVSISVPAPNRVAGTAATLTLTLQGTTLQAHAVDVLVGAQRLGTVSFTGQAAPRASFTVPQELLGDPTTVTLRSLNGSMDYAVLDVLALEYSHLYSADGDALAFSAAPGGPVSVSGFSSASVTVVDVSDPLRPVRLTPALAHGAEGWTATVQVPAGGGRRILAVGAGRVRTPASVEANVPSRLATRQRGASFLVLAHPSLVPAAAPLTAKRVAEGLVTRVVDVTDVYDEFSYGEKAPEAIRSFLRHAWKKAWDLWPRYVLLLGDASFDPRNYLGLGAFDLVPTSFVPTQLLMTASDDAFVDFELPGRPELAVGRLPARTAADAAGMVAKVLARGAAPPGNDVVVGSDVSSDFDFSEAAGSLAGLVPAPLSVLKLDASSPPPGGFRSAFVAALNAGPSQATWVGHGSEATLGIQTVFDGADALGLTNARPTVFLAADCLNGYFQDVYGDALAESLLKSPSGGAAAVWASSALTEPVPQMEMFEAFYAALYGNNPAIRLGDAVVKAKRAAGDLDVRRAWILFGDPAMPAR